MSVFVLGSRNLNKLSHPHMTEGQVLVESSSDDEILDISDNREKAGVRTTHKLSNLDRINSLYIFLL